MTPDIKAIKQAAIDSDETGFASVLTNNDTVISLCDEVERLTSAQQPATPADVPMLMVDEIRKVSDKADEGQESTEFMLAFARAIEQLVRQKASIK